MIRYALNCRNDHEFEAWFRSSADYDEQRSQEIIFCPTCGSPNVEKAIMAPNIATGSAAKSDFPSADGTGHDNSAIESPLRNSANRDANADASSNQSNDIHGLHLPDPREMVEAVRKYRDEVMENAENVGDRFAEEARKIHYEEEKPRGIYGNASPDEVKDLLEEGVEIAPLPVLPEDNN